MLFRNSHFLSFSLSLNNNDQVTICEERRVILIYYRYVNFCVNAPHNPYIINCIVLCICQQKLNLVLYEYKQEQAFVILYLIKVLIFDWAIMIQKKFPFISK